MLFPVRVRCAYPGYNAGSSDFLAGVLDAGDNHAVSENKEHDRGYREQPLSKFWKRYKSIAKNKEEYKGNDERNVENDGSPFSKTQSSSDNNGAKYKETKRGRESR